MYHRITPLLLILALAACSTFSPKKKDDSYKLEHFTPDSPFEQSFDTGAAASCCRSTGSASPNRPDFHHRSAAYG